MQCYLDCFAGISGDMFLGALLDAGVPPAYLEEELARLDLPALRDLRLEAQEVHKQGIRATNLLIHVPEETTHRHLPEITGIINKSGLSPAVKDLAVRVFTRLAAAEARVHGTSPEKIHFHEVGALDAIVDIVGAAIALEWLGFPEIHASPPNLGSGFVTCAHGTFPVPAPATIELLRGAPAGGYPPVEGELTTPTGAALLVTLAASFGPMPALTIEKVGYGAGKRDLAIPNVLRLLLGETATPPSDADPAYLSRPTSAWGMDPDAAGVAGQPSLPEECLSELVTTIDDMNPEFYPYFFQEALAAGAVDVYTTPIVMKKGRPAQELTVLCPLAAEAKLSNLLLRETTSLGLRIRRVARRCLSRQVRAVQTPYGEVRVKIGYREGESAVPSNFAPEYEDCQALARARGIPLKEVYQAALDVARRELGGQ